MKRYTLEETINSANIIHDYFYDYKNVLPKRMDEKVEIICPKHGPFQQRMAHHIHRRHGCMKCAKEKMSEYYMHSTKMFIEKSILVHGQKYNYSISNYNGVFKNLSIICPVHGIFEQTPTGHLAGKGCWQCGGSFPLTNEEFIIKAKEKHQNFYDYLKTDYINAKTKITITCPDHGDFQQTPNSHLDGSKCRKCNANISKGEIEWLNSLGIPERQMCIKVGNRTYKADGFDHHTNSVYEYHGDYWHGNPKRYAASYFNKRKKCTMGEIYQKTIEREQAIRDAGYNLIVMWESDWKINQNPPC